MIPSSDTPGRIREQRDDFDSAPLNTRQRGAPVSILAIVVLYKTSPEDSVTVQTLQAATRATGSDQIRLLTVLYDNTPGGQQVTWPTEMRYQAAPSNPGLAVAYNAVLEVASAEGYDWLLTLDQDTVLPTSFLESLLTYVRLYGKDGRVGAIVPHVTDRGRPISPFRFVGGFLPRMYALTFSGVASRYASAINSASLLRVATLQQIQGYDERFPLNNSDTSLFHRLSQAGKRVVVAGGTFVQHELAIMERSERMTPERYQKLLADERSMWDLHMGWPGRVERLLRLVGRVSRDRLTGRHEAFRAITLHEIRYRLTTSRRERLKSWNRLTRQQ